MSEFVQSVAANPVCIGIIIFYFGVLAVRLRS